MRMEKFTIKAQEAIQEAQQTALKSGHPEVGSAHLLAALLGQEGGLISPLLQKIGADPSHLKGQVILLLDKLPRQSGGTSPNPSADLQRILAGVEDEAQRL